MALNLNEYLHDIKKKLKDAGCQSPELDAGVLCAHVLDLDRFDMLARIERTLSRAEAEIIDGLVERRIQGEPVAYCTGIKEFYSLDFEVDRNVLVPRPDTELLVDMAVYYAPLNGEVCEIGTGSGAAAVALCHSRPDISMTATDISAGAISVAEKNAQRILWPGKIEFLEGDLFSPLENRSFDLILSNPPYINPEEREGLQKELSFEPEIALFGDEEGYAVVKKLITGAVDFLHGEGTLLLEIGYNMKDNVYHMAEESGYTASFMNDYSGHCRVAVLKKKPSGN